MPGKETRADKRRRIVDSEKYVVPTGRSADEIDNYIRELRDNEPLQQSAINELEKLSEGKEAFERLEQLRKKGMVTDYDAELASCREEKYGKDK